MILLSYPISARPSGTLRGLARLAKSLALPSEKQPRTLSLAEVARRSRQWTDNPHQYFKKGDHMNGAFSTSVPHLETERLTLREYRREDFDAFAAHCAAHFAPADRASAWRIFGSHAGLWLLDGAGWWALEHRHTGQVVGSVGAFFREDCTVMELGWNTYSAFWGQGFANEAAAAALKYALEIRREPKVRALIAPGNESSIRVARRLGFTYEAQTEIHGKAVGSYTRAGNGAIA
jgi:RimJ/RimL family protein N-acetyltransferase